MVSNRVNPASGKRFDWEAQEAERRRVDPKAIDQEIALLERQRVALEARDDLLTFTQFTMPDPTAPNDVHRSRYEPANFHRAIARHLEEFERGEIKQLILTLPPRAGKTEIATKRFTAWYMGRNPFDSMAITTYSDTMAEDYGADIRAIMSSTQFRQVFPKFSLRRGGAAKANIQTEQGGRVVAVGVGGALTGRGANCFLAGTKITTPNGAVSIETLERNSEVYCYDTITCALEVRRVEAVAHRSSARLFRVATAAGRVVEATPDHPFYTARGYVPAHELAAGDRLVQLVREEDKSDRIRDNEARKTRADGALLFASVLVGLREREPLWATHVRCLWGACAAEVQSWVLRQHVLLRRVFEDTSGARGGGASGEVALADVRRVREALSDRPRTDQAPSEEGAVGGPILRHGLQESVAFPVDARREQPWLPAWFVAAPCTGSRREGVSRHEASHPRARRSLLRALLRDWQIARASRRAGSEGQSLAESDLTLPKLPLRTARKRAVDRSVAADEILRVDEVPVGAGGVEVYDIQVSEHHNFFANGILVHNCLIVDDPVKNAEDARSQTMRDAAWEWFIKVAMTRRMGKKLVLIITTRWHTDDIVGRLTDKENDHYNEIEAQGWKIINIPAIAEEDDPLGRKPGEALWPERYDLEFLAQQQRLDPLGFAALYQQRPTVADGVLFRRENIQRYKPHQRPADLRFYAASDHAVGTKQRNDPSCFGKAGVDAQDNLWFTELFWERVTTDRAVEQMLSMGSGTDAPVIWWGEKGHISMSIGPFLRKAMLESQRFINVREITPSQDKQTRAQSIAARVAVGKVYIPEGPVWDRAVEEMLAFPNGTHDDFVDMLSLFGIGLQSQFGASPPSPKKAEPAFGTLGWVKRQDSWDKVRKRERIFGGF